METIIRRRLMENLELVSKLAGFDTDFGQEPAIFYARTPYDSDMLNNYPQIILSAEKFSDAAHGISGSLNIEIVCTQEFSPADISRLVKKTLEGVLFRGEEIFILQWQKSEPFTEPAAERTPLVVGELMTFGIYELPRGIISTPDPIQALQIWAKSFDENLIVVGVSEFENFFEPTNEQPALWISQTKLELDHVQNFTAFVSVEVKFHIFAPDLAGRQAWTMALYQELLFLKAIKLSDGSPLRLQKCEINFTSDSITGQLNASFDYGILARKTYAHPLNKVLTEHSGKIRSYENYLRR